MNVSLRGWERSVKDSSKRLPKRMLGSITKGNTTIREEDGMTVIRYHYTDIVKFDDAIVILNTGGWWSVTTKARMNQVADEFNLAFKVSSGDVLWEVCHNPEGGSVYADGCIVHDYNAETLVIDRHQWTEAVA